MSLPASRCPVCQREAVPPEPACRGCGGSTDPQTVEAQGTVVAATKRGQRPWVLLVDLDGPRVLADSRHRHSVGETVRLTTAEDRFHVEPEAEEEQA